jgi:hypothetical protein
VTRQIHRQLAGPDVPDLKSGILGRRNQHARVCRETALVDSSHVAAEGVNEPKKG